MSGVQLTESASDLLKKQSCEESRRPRNWGDGSVTRSGAMRVQRIMCPVDFSESSTAALDDAASLALQLGAQLLIVHVDEHPLLSGAASPSLAQKMAERRTQLEQTTPNVNGVAIERHLLRGKAVEEIPRFARIYNVDLVIMGRQEAHERFHHRHDGLCQVTSRQCPCPVMTINHEPAQVSWSI
jgi:nucleotide-binding universal stress UspA family protein